MGVHTIRRRIVASALRERITALYLQGHSQTAIGRQLRLNQGTVSRHLSAVRRLWDAKALLDFDRLIADTLAKLDLVEREAWDQWERSKSSGSANGTEESDGKRRKRFLRIESQTGDVRYLGIIAGTIAKRCELLGLARPKRADTSPRLLFTSTEEKCN